MTIPTAPTGPRKAQSKNIFIGCLIALGVFVVLVGVGLWALYAIATSAAKTFVVGTVLPQVASDINASSLPLEQKKAAVAAIDRISADIEAGRISMFDQNTWIEPARGAAHAWVAELDLPDAQKTGLTAQIDRLADGSIDGTIGQKQWEAIANAVENSGLSRMIAAWAMKLKYVYPSDLPADEKTAAATTFDRVARGAADGSITEPELDAVAKEYEAVDPQSGAKTMRTLTTDELRELIEKLDTLADENEVPAGEWQPDYAGELKRAIDQALGTTTSP